MARGLTLALVAVVGVQLAVATFDYHPYGTPLIFYPPTFYNAPNYFQPFPYSSSGSIQAIRIAVDRQLPCPAEGFYTNPSNCSQFYRCVDHTGTGQWFVRYVFECPSGHFFAAEVATCLPGTCDGTQPPVMPPKPPVQPIPPILPITPVQPPVEPVEPPVQPPIHPITPVLPPVEPPPSTDSPTDDMATTLTPVDGTEPPQPPATEPPQPPATDPPQTPTEPPTQQPDPDCIGQYLQHQEFCNSYIRCNETGQRYICPAGTVFDEPRQMCRISAGDESLCAGKTIAAFPYFLRTELVEGHILLPDDYVLRPLNPFQPQTLPLQAPDLSPFQIDLRNQPLAPPIAGSVPANSPSLRTPANPSVSQPGPPPSPVGSSSSSFSRPGSPIPASPFRSPSPTFSRPGSPVSSPSQSPFPANSPSLTFTGNQPSRFSPFSPFPADTQGLNVLSSSAYSPQSVPSPYIAGPLSINNVRRPSGHLHFPHFTPFGLPEYHPYHMEWRR